jgi:hypothetical protein
VDDGNRGGLVDNAEDLQASDLLGESGGRALGLSKVRGTVITGSP